MSVGEVGGYGDSLIPVRFFCEPKVALKKHKGGYSIKGKSDANYLSQRKKQMHYRQNPFLKQRAFACKVFALTVGRKL